MKYTDKNGKRRAHYWGLARRWLPISIDAAELELATGKALPAETATPGQSAYEADCLKEPTYKDGSQRKPWSALPEHARYS
jgi:hypothetical protein